MWGAGVRVWGYYFRLTLDTRTERGGLAQLARALALYARGHRFDSDILHRVCQDVWLNLWKAKEERLQERGHRGLIAKGDW